jgi:hypothetical protein
LPVSLYLTANNLAELRTAYLAKVVAIDLTAAAIALPTSVQARSNVFDAWRSFRTWRRRGMGRELDCPSLCPAVPVLTTASPGSSDYRNDEPAILVIATDALITTDFQHSA